MASDETRLAVIETRLKGVDMQVDRLREHVSELLTFKNTWEGGLKAMLWMLGFLGLSNFAALGYLIYKAKFN